jgi:hypothetical protein
MVRQGATGRRSALAAIILLVAAWTPAAAHETKGVGDLRLTVGWGEEPAFSGFRNFVEVDVADAAGRPVADLGGALSVEVSFGDERISLSLLPARGQPGKFVAWLVPTRPGTYSLHITGTARGQAIDMTSTCSQETFACVADVSDIQFPVKDPSAGQLADRISRELPRAEGAMEAATGARTLALAGLAGAAFALVAAVGFGLRKGSTGR